MGIYTHTITASEFSLNYRSSSKWTNYSKLYDGDATTYPTNQSGSIGLLIDMSWLPSDMRICGIRARAGAKRKGSSTFHMWLRSANKSGDQGTGYYALTELEFDKGEYNTWSWHELIGDGNVVGGSIAITAKQSENFLSRPYQYIVMNDSTEKSEIELTFEYTEADNQSKIYVGDAKVSAVYVGDTKASAVYVGTTKVL